MSSSNLVNLDVDTLFEQHSVPEIDIVHKKIQTVVENKREELRLMVGERYRDLLKAADTITSMQQSSSGLIEKIDAITNNCRKLNEQQLIGFKIAETADVVPNRQAHKELNNYYSIMIQIKLLTELPELIWSHLEREQFYAATELFIFSRHISTGLQLDASNPIIQKLPVAKKQWEILKPFHSTIKQSVFAVLEREELSADVVVECLLSLLLLEKNTLNGVFKTFLQFRCAAFRSCVSDKETGSHDMEKWRIKDRILASLKILNSTMELMASCFLENSLLVKKLAEHSDSNAPPTILLMDRNDIRFSHILPEIISNFRPKLEARTLDSAFVRTTLEQWLFEIRQIVGVHLKNLFDLVTTMNTIQEIKNEANIFRKHLNFAPIAEAFDLHQPIDFYELKYAPIINQRVRDIIHNSWGQTMENTYSALMEALENVNSKDVNIWAENSSDLPGSLEEALSDDLKIKKLLMKTKGYDSEIIKLCTQFDSQLGVIVSEMNVLLEEQTTRAEDKLALIEFLRETAEAQLKEFIGKIKGLELKAEQRMELLLVVRVCLALIELCPNLKICFCQRSSWRQWVGNVTASSIEIWNNICLMWDEEIFKFWQEIVDGVLMDNNCNQHLPQSMTHDVVLSDFANWELLTIEQKDEQDNAVHSTFRIPNQPCVFLQSYLFSIIRELNMTVPQTLPTKVLHYFNNKLLTHILKHYEMLVSHAAASTDNVTASNINNQTVALQLYFDLKFLQNIFAVSRDERSLCNDFQTLQTRLKENIDPFDFELFSEHIIVNVKRAVVRLNCELGVITPSLAQGSTAVKATSITHERDPNILGLSSTGSTSLWFPLLPIVTGNVQTASSTPLGEIEKEEEKQTTTTTTSTPTRNKAVDTTATTSSSTSLAASASTSALASTSASTSASRKSDATAAAATMSKSKSFFGAMSQEWFR